MSGAAGEPACASGAIGVVLVGVTGALGVTGSAIKPSLRLLKMFDPTEGSSVPSSAVLILDPCSSLRSFID